MTRTLRRPSRRAGLTSVTSLLLACLLAVSGAAATGAQDAPEPELTWAPLVTLPPIVAPSVVSPAELADGYTLGDPDAPVAIEVWEDFQCPFCQLFALQIKPLIVSEYVETGKASLTFRNLAFLGDESHWAAVAGDLAAEQNGFWPFHDYLFANLLGENVGSYDLDRLLAMAEAAGLDMEAFRAGLVLDKARERFARIETESRQDAGALGISSTPSLVLDGQLLVFDDFEQALAAIDAAVVAAGGADVETGGEPSGAPAGSDAGAAAEASAEPAASPAG